MCALKWCLKSPSQTVRGLVLGLEPRGNYGNQCLIHFRVPWRDHLVGGQQTLKAPIDKHQSIVTTRHTLYTRLSAEHIITLTLTLTPGGRYQNHLPHYTDEERGDERAEVTCWGTTSTVDRTRVEPRSLSTKPVLDHRLWREQVGRKCRRVGWGGEVSSLSQVGGHHWERNGQEGSSHHQAYAGILILSLYLGPLWNLSPYPSTSVPGCPGRVHAFPWGRRQHGVLCLGTWLFGTVRGNVVKSFLVLSREAVFLLGFGPRSFQKEGYQ